MSDQGPLIPRNREMHPLPYFPDYKTSIARSPNLPPSTICAALA